MKYRSFPDLTDQIFGKITVIDGKLPNQKVLIRCECGFEKTVRRYDVFNGKIQSCGRKECPVRKTDLVGNKYSLLTVISIVPPDDLKDITGGCSQWNCQCECGNVLIVPSNQLTSGRTKSCGCAKSVWISVANSLPIKDRVENQLYREYRQNAERRDLSFFLTKEQFVSYLYENCFYCGEPPLNCMTKEKVTGEEKYYFNGIDRVNNKGGYSVDNCVTCCKLCNHAKNNLSKEDFISLAKRIAVKF